MFIIIIIATQLHPFPMPILPPVLWEKSLLLEADPPRMMPTPQMTLQDATRQ